MSIYNRSKSKHEKNTVSGHDDAIDGFFNVCHHIVHFGNFNFKTVPLLFLL